MFDFGFAEMLLTAVIGLLVLGPKRLPKAARTVGLWVRKARASWFSLRAELERELADEDMKASLRDARNEVSRLRDELSAPLIPPTAKPLGPSLGATPDSASGAEIEAPVAESVETPVVESAARPSARDNAADAAK